MSEEIIIPWYVFVGIGIPLIGIAVAMGKLKQKVQTLETNDQDSSKTHNSLFSKLNKIERNLYHLMGKLDVKPVD